MERYVRNFEIKCFDARNVYILKQPENQNSREITDKRGTRGQVCEEIRSKIKEF